MWESRRSSLTSIPLSYANLTAAIEHGIRYLAKAQQPSGDFETLTSPQPDFSGATPYKKSIYVTTNAITNASLRTFGDMPTLESIQLDIARFTD